MNKQYLLLILACIRILGVHAQGLCPDTGGSNDGTQGGGGSNNGTGNTTEDPNAIDWSISRLHAVDPNDIIGPTGIEAEQWVGAEERLSYKIRYENDPEFATAPAQLVMITHDLDPYINPFSFRLGTFGFGAFNFTVPPNTTSYFTELDVTDSLGVIVQFTAGVDVVNNQAFWILNSIDPETGLPPDDALLGFLPVNDTTINRFNDTTTQVGEGYVDFSVVASRDAVTGDTTSAQASIVFDINEAIITNTWQNLIDADPPVSQVDSVTTMNDTTFLVHTTIWETVDGSGASDLTLFIAKDGGNYEELQSSVRPDEVVEVKLLAGDYCLFSQARDSVDNWEALKNSPDACFQVTREIEVEPLVLTCLEQLILPAGEECTASMPDLQLEVTVTGTLTSLTITQNVPIGTLLPLGSTQVTVTADDGLGGFETCTIELIVVDDTPPVIECQSPLEISVDGNCEAVVPNLTERVFVFDNCTENVTVTQDLMPGTDLPLGETRSVTLTAVDDQGNSRTCTIDVIAVDAGPPLLTCPGEFIIPASEACNALMPDLSQAVMATDNCSEMLLISQDVPAGSTLPVGSTLVTVAAEDGAGNRTTCLVDVKLTLPPLAIQCPSDRTITPNFDVPALMPDLTTEVTFTPACLQMSEISQSIPVGAELAPGETEVLINVKTEDGQEQQCLVKITVEEAPQPFITLLPEQLQPFKALIGEFSEEQSFEIEAGNLQEAVEMTVPSAFEFRSEFEDTWMNQVSLLPVDGKLASQPIKYFVRLREGADSGVYSGRLTAQTRVGSFGFLEEDIELLGEVLECAAITFAFEATGEMCPSTSDGMIEFMEVMGGATPYLYSIDGGNSFSDDPAFGELSPGTYNLLVRDADGCPSGPQSIELIAEDQQPPVILCPSDLLLPADNTCQAALPDLAASATAVDNCAETLLISQDIPVGTLLPIGSTLVTLTADDGNGNAASCTVEVTVEDDAAAVFNCPAAQTMVAGANCQAIMPDFIPDLPSESCHSIENITQSPAAGGEVNVGLTAVTLTFDLLSGDAFTCDFSLLVEPPLTGISEFPGTGEPSEGCDAEDLSLESAGFAYSPSPVFVTPVAFEGAGGALDGACAIFELSYFDAVSGTCPAVVTRTWTTKDVAGNESMEIREFILEQNTPPVLAPLPPLSVECLEEAPVDPSIVEITEGCGEVLVTHEQDLQIGNVCEEGIVERTYRATDPCGNFAEVTQVIHVLDVTPPVFVDPPGELRISAAEELPEVVEPEVIDNCDGDVSLGYRQLKIRIDPDCDKEFNLLHIWTATDCSGNSSEHRQRIIVRDLDTPYFTTDELPGDISGEDALSCGDEIPPPVTLEAFDECDGPLPVVFRETTEESGCPGQVFIRREWIATDCSGKVAAHRQRIRVIDREKPIFDNPEDLPGDLIGSNFVTCENIPLAPNITATDDCDGAIAVSFTEEWIPRAHVNPDVTSCPDDFILVRVWSATDCRGRKTVHRQRIVVRDEQPPAIVVPTDIEACPGEGVFFGLPDVFDSCDDEVVVEVESDVALTPTDGGYVGEFPLGEHTVTIRATDHCRNETKVAFTVFISNCDLSRAVEEPPHVAAEPQFLEFYPNPFEQQLQMQLVSTVDDVVDVEIYDLTGARIASVLRHQSVAKGVRYVLDITPDQPIAQGIIIILVRGANINTQRRIMHK